MQSMNDDDLRNLLRKWEAPSLPPAVEKKILAGATSPAGAFVRWLMTGSIRVPAPVAVAMVLVCILLGIYAYRSSHTAQTTMAEFQPVKDFNPRIIRSVYEPK